MVFGSKTKEYSIVKAQRFVTEGKFDKAKEYVSCYFARMKSPASCVLVWLPAKNAYDLLKDTDASKTYFSAEAKNGNFDLKKWFFKENTTLYILDVDPMKPKLYEKQGGLFINDFKGYLHDAPRKWKEFPPEVKDAVKTIWKHVKTVWCSGKKDQYEYVKNG